jgi:hypothetical protein
MADFRTIKMRLWEKNPHCHYCGVKTEPTEAGVNKCTHNPNTATVDHVYSRFNLKRWVYGEEGEVRYVLACQHCNNQRQIQEFKSLPPIERAARMHGFAPRLKRMYGTMIEAYYEMKKIYSRYGVPTESIDRQVYDTKSAS